ncbi:hypothetical protein [Streptococcus merionis]|uniref:hypothetical protein n=1 Tax=Streptococcus merionis TaxID=400065 RepID=UPI003514CF93
MNRDDLLQMLRATKPRDKTFLEDFLTYQALHFDEDWESLIENFMTGSGQDDVPIPIENFEAEISAFVMASSLSGVTDLANYTQTFGQKGLEKLPQLSQEEKDLVIEVALYNLATRFQLFDSDGAYHSISLLTLLDKGDSANLVNVYRIANNLSDRISRDIEQFLLTYEPEVVAEEPEVADETKTIGFREEEGVIIASLEGDLSQLDVITGKTSHLPFYEQLSLPQKFEILTYFDQVRQDYSKIPDFRRGAFDVAMEMVPVYDGDQLLTYLEADGSMYELQRDLTAVETEALTIISKAILAENTNRLRRLEISLEDFGVQKQGILLDAVGRFRLKDDDLLLLGAYPEASETSLALATELLQMGMVHDKVTFFLTSHLTLDDLRQVAFAFLHEDCSLETASAFEEAKQRQPDLAFKEWREEMLNPQADIELAQTGQDNPLVLEVLETYPLGTTVSYKGQNFDVIAVEDAGLDGMVRVELQNDYSLLVDENSVLYVRTMEEISEMLHLAPSELIVEKEEQTQELDLFSFMEEETSSIEAEMT